MQKMIQPTKRDFPLLVLVQIVSILGTSLLRFALSLHVLDVTGRADIFATMYALSSIPLLLAPLGGAFADRFSRRNLMASLDFTAAAMVAIFLSLLVTGNAGLWSIGCVMVVLAVLSSLYGPSVTASIPQLVPQEKLEGANGIVQAVQALSGVFAPMAGAVMYSTMGLKSLMIFSGIAFSLSAILTLLLRIPFEKRQVSGNIVATIASDLKEGFAFVIKQPFIRKCMLLAALMNLLLTPVFVVGAPTILRVTMQSSDNQYGIGMSVINAATILGALSIGLLAKHMHKKKLYRWMIAIGLLLIPMALAVMPVISNAGFYPSYLTFITFAVPVCALLTMLSIFVITWVQRSTPDQNLGKVMAIVAGVSQCAAPLGQMLYGVVFERFHQNMYLPILGAAAAMLGIAVLTKKMLSTEKED